MIKFKILCIFLGLFLISSLGVADTLNLVDGTAYKGKFIKGDINTIVFQSDGKTMYFPTSSVSSISIGEKELKSPETESKGKGLLRGVLTYYHNRYIGYKPDLGATIYACNIKTDIKKIASHEELKDVLNSPNIDGFIKDYLRYKRVDAYRYFINKGEEREKNMKYSKELGVETENDWDVLEKKVWRILSNLKYGTIPSRKTTVSGDGTFSIELPAGYYFLFFESKNRPLLNDYQFIKISDGETEQVSVEFFM